MRPTRDQLIAAAAVLVFLVLTASVIGLVRDAEQAGIRTREDLRTEEVVQLANSMDSRVRSAFASLAGTYGVPGAWKLVEGDPADAAMLEPSSPQATTGSLLVDRDGTILNGSLLRDPDVVGTPLDRPGLDAALEGTAVILPVAPGLTTTEPTLAIGIPVRDAGGAVAGAVIIESEVSADSAFNQEIAELQAGETGLFSFVDGTGMVVASSDETRLATRVDESSTSLDVGFHRSGDRVFAVAEVPSADWRLVFEQTTDEFQGDLTGPVRIALILLLIATAIGGALAVVALLHRLRAAREEQRRLASMSAAREEFTSVVSHELRTPVAGLLGFLQTTVDHWQEMSEDERRRAVERAFQNARRLQHLTADVMDAASIDADEITYRFAPVDLRDVVQDAIELALQAEPHRRFDVELGEEPVIVEADASRLRQVLTNLLDNASKSSPVDAPVTVALTPGPQSVTVSVHDRGAGIAVDERERVFEKFTRGRQGVTRGSGLGLYIARRIVTAHGGRIWVEDTEGPGASVAFSIPVRVAAEASVTT